VTRILQGFSEVNRSAHQQNTGDTSTRIQKPVAEERSEFLSGSGNSSTGSVTNFIPTIEKLSDEEIREFRLISIRRKASSRETLGTKRDVIKREIKKLSKADFANQGKDFY
jgi:hypothetical protein